MSKDSATYNGLTAPIAMWRALGAVVDVYSSPPGVAWQYRYGSDTIQDAGIALMLLETARDQLAGDATDEQIVRRAIRLRYEMRLAQESGQRRVSGAIDHRHTVRAPQLDRLLPEEDRLLPEEGV